MGYSVVIGTATDGEGRQLGVDARRARLAQVRARAQPYARVGIMWIVLKVVVLTIALFLCARRLCETNPRDARHQRHWGHRPKSASIGGANRQPALRGGE